MKANKLFHLIFKFLRKKKQEENNTNLRFKKHASISLYIITSIYIFYLLIAIKFDLVEIVNLLISDLVIRICD